MLPAADQLLEDVYNLINRTKDEPQRLELARIAKLAVEYRAMQIKRQRTQRAIDRVAEERRLLRSGASRDEQQRAADEPFRRDGA